MLESPEHGKGVDLGIWLFMTISVRHERCVVASASFERSSRVCWAINLLNASASAKLPVFNGDRCAELDFRIPGTLH